MKHKIATVIASPVIFDLEATAKKCCDIINEAADKGASLVVFPETFLPMYPWWIWMAVDNVKRLELYERLAGESVDVHGDVFKSICYQARRRNIHVVIGINEIGGDTLYNSQAFIDNRGDLIGLRRKLVPTGEERTLWGRGDGSDLLVLDTEIGRLGGLICYENSMALSRYALYSQGLQIHVANWPGSNFKSQPRDRTRTIDTVCRFIAFEGQTFVVASSSCIGEEEVRFYHQLCPELKDSFAVGGGIAAVYNPFGEPVGTPMTDQEGIVYADLDLGDIRKAKHMIDCVGHYARPDVARLVIDDGSKLPVTGFSNTRPQPVSFEFDD
ncbi:carbon-nitrogen hydrolase family protein [Alloalcanivorax xenomutans]|uniref:carbon-nitrogen hydrolase family protein n=1 Tax=Alloalcanivorax xenomutans TaxID=1094342 RepID=UPI001823D3A8|nr:carbon-nitrogen hydrolase family protein [Alloalcanivorax xenomutans]MBA4722107.1 carbon-nitrogen hydrolase family protein [Alcanivorax sp.]WOA32991.1 carbon-nitrogen hydrolase family protein [Alloalcanivorax xenomutans]